MLARIAFLTSVSLSTVLAASAAFADVTISSAQTQNMSCSGGVCAPTATTATLNVNDLENLLASGNVEVTTTGTSVQAGNIVANTALTWSATSTLGLDAYQSIAIDSTVSVTGQGGLSLTTNDGGSGGALSFGRNDSATFASLSSQLTINGAVYTLVGNISSLASAIASNPSGDYALANNYDASRDGTYSNSPIAASLTGVVEGLGNTISNLSIQGHEPEYSYVGLFASISADGTLENLELSDIQFEIHGAQAGATGGLAGLNKGVIFGERISGAINAKCCRDPSYNALAGGLVGVNEGSISNASSQVRVAVPYKGYGGDGAAGGLVGLNAAGGRISLSNATGNVTGLTVGGLAAVNGYSNANLSTIDQSWSSGSATGGELASAGGLVGGNSDYAVISNSYATGSAKTGNGVNGNEFCACAGGFAGQNVTGAEIEDSYSKGSVKGGDYLSYVGGFVAESDTDVSNDYWDTTTSGTDDGVSGGNEPGITGLTTRQLKSGLPAGFDPSIWAENPKINNGLPYLINNPPAK